MEKSNKTIGSREIATVAVLLAICIVSQLFKNLSIYITGPIINTCIILCVLMVNLPVALILCIITPVTAFFITGAPVMAAVPAVIPCVMLGNAALAVGVHFLMKKEVIAGGAAAGGIKSYIKAVVCAAIKGAVMGLTISLWLLPTFIPAESPLRGKMGVLQAQFSIHQFLTTLIGFAYVFVIWVAVSRSKLVPEKA